VLVVRVDEEVVEDETLDELEMELVVEEVDVL
jgi:hypothetical protein